MTTSTAILRAKAISLLGCMTLLAASTLSAIAQKPEARILAPIDNANRIMLSGSRPMLAQTANDAGRMAGTAQLQQMTLVFSRSAAQQSSLDALTAAQQNPASPQFHQWLTPTQFGTQFGAADADIAKVQGWLQSQGFSVGEVTQDRTMIAFSGAIAQVETAFGTEMHYFAANGEKHFGPAMDLSLPAALAPAVLSVGNLTDARPHSHMRPIPDVSVKSNFTSAQSGNHFVQPGDVAVIYDINAAYSAGYTGQGQTIAVVGQSAILATDIAHFQTAAGVPVRSPTLTLVPNTGVSTINPNGAGDESESDLDLEYTSAIAKGATINFVYTGNSSNNGGAFYALIYAIQNKLAPIISSSYGDCEIDLGSQYQQYDAYMQQASVQGQTVISAAGDNGSTDCHANTNLSTAVRDAVAVDWPAGSQYVTGMGGTEYTSAAVAATNSTYFTAANGTDVLVSAKSYIPEQVWNDDSPPTSTFAGGLSSGGGGVSIYSAHPIWQTGVPGITAGMLRMVPDISLASSPNNAGYLYCSSDTSTGVTGSCSNGFRDATNTSLTLAGGTSFAAPIFAGMLAIINQKTNVPSQGQGNINPILYKLAGNPTTYASAFHDITSGSNACVAGVTICGTGTQTTLYSAGVGYDEATGLGSIDLYNLMQAWPAYVAPTSTTTVTAATLNPQFGATDLVTFKVASTSSSLTTVPTGTITLTVGTAVPQTLTLSGGIATYSFNAATVGVTTLTAVYSGDSTYSTSTGAINLTVAAPGSFTVSAPSTTVADGSSTSTVITLTPTGGFTGGVYLALTTSVTVSNACYTLNNANITGVSAVTATATIYTDGSTCPSGAYALLRTGGTKHAEAAPQPIPARILPVGLAMAGLFAVGFVGRKSRKLRGMIAVALLAVAGFAMSGCSSSSNSGGAVGTSGTTSSTLAPKGTNTVTVTATDAATGSKTVTSTFTLTIQ